MKAAAALLGLFALAAVAPSVAGLGLSASCAPPCGYIFPTIIVTSPVKGTLWLNETMEVPLTIIYEWNFDNDATGIHEANKPITLTFDAPKRPNWVDWTVEPEVIVLEPPEFNPLTTYHYEKSATVTLTPKDSVPLEERAGTKMLLFVQSSESGTFKKSYGVEVFKFPGDGSLTGTEQGQDVGVLPGVGGLGAFAAFVAAAAAVFVARRKR